MDKELEPLGNTDFDIFDNFDPEVLKSMVAKFQAQAAAIANPEKCTLKEVLSKIADAAAANGVRHREQSVNKVTPEASFVESLYDAFNEVYAQYGDEKVYLETIIASFYGAAFAAVVRKKECIAAEVCAFSILSDRVNITEVTSHAEEVLGLDMAAGENMTLWNMVYNYANTCVMSIRKLASDDDKHTATIASGVHACDMASAYIFNR